MASQSRPRVAAIVTEYRPRAHADVIVTKLLKGYSLYDEPTEPRIEVASLYLDQIPDNDIGVGLAKEHNVPIFESIGEAIGVGEAGVNVDGILLIGEHGDYPYNEYEQKLYPRRRLFDAAAAAMAVGGKSVPVFNDKHLSWSFRHARAMYDTAARLGAPFLAGSSVPVAWRSPATDWPYDAPMDEAVAIGHGGIESYGFHALEALQCMVERRQGGERGVRSVQCIEGPAVLEALQAGRFSREVADAALATVEAPSIEEALGAAPAPAAFLIEYADGLRATVLMLDGVARQFAFAGRGSGGDTATGMILQSGDPHGHFTFLVRQIESLVLTGQSPYPVERTLLTTGILEAAMWSRHRSQTPIETPWLGISYQAPEVIADTGNGAPLPTPR